jgi:hypothetical protein
MSSQAGRIVYVQDSQFRHVAIKVVDKVSDEYRIYEHIYRQGIADSVQSFECVIPVLDLLTIDKDDEHCFIVMPRSVEFVPDQDTFLLSLT